MVVQWPQYWDVAVDVIQIVLCILIVGLLIRNRRQNRETARNVSSGYAGPNFNVQIFRQTLKVNAFKLSIFIWFHDVTTNKRTRHLLYVTSSPYHSRLIS